MQHECTKWCDQTCGPACPNEGNCEFVCAHECTPFSYCTVSGVCRHVCSPDGGCITKCPRPMCAVMVGQIREDAKPWRYIMYVEYPSGGFDVLRVLNQDEAKAALVRYCEENYLYHDELSHGVYGARGSLYGYSPDYWSTALEYRDSGNPFDYPDYWVLRGPRGGVRIERA